MVPNIDAAQLTFQRISHALFQFLHVIDEGFSPGTCWHVTSMFLFWSYHGHKFTELCNLHLLIAGWKVKGTAKSSVNISPQICTNIWWSSSAAEICLRFWVATVQLQPPCCVVCTHMFDPRSKSIMLILNHLGPRRIPEGLLQPPSRGKTNRVLTPLPLWANALPCSILHCSAVLGTGHSLGIGY